MSWPQSRWYGVTWSARCIGTMRSTVGHLVNSRGTRLNPEAYKWSCIPCACPLCINSHHTQFSSKVSTGRGAAGCEVDHITQSPKLRAIYNREVSYRMSAKCDLSARASECIDLSCTWLELAIVIRVHQLPYQEVNSVLGGSVDRENN